MAIIAKIVQQHAEQTESLYTLRSLLVHSPQVKVHHLQRFDERLVAHLDGLAVAGEHGWAFCEAALEASSPGGLFTLAVRAIEQRDHDRLDRLVALIAAAPEMGPGLKAAFGWVERRALQGTVTKMLRSSDPLARTVGIAACAMHRVDPGLTSAGCFEDSDAAVRARAWRTVGELGKYELVSAGARTATYDGDPACQFWAAWSAVLLGDKEHALEFLTNATGTPGPFQNRAFQLTILAMSMGAAHALLQPLAQDPASIRQLVRGAGLGGNPIYVPWLIDLMTDDKLARLAGEAFSLVTGLDLTGLNLERKRPPNLPSAPNDDPNDPNVEMDEDDGLPWPHQKLIQDWWNTNSHRFPPGVRCFMGEPVNRENCLRVLKEGYQRQRIAAAFYLSLLNPGTPLFEWRAPAYRQQRLLATMN